jgi:subtilisin family serine protease
MRRRTLLVGAGAVALAVPAVAAAFRPNDPLQPKQWYLTDVRAFDAWSQRPSLPLVRVAVIDSGIDANHPEFAGRIALKKSFVGGSAGVDLEGHGTFVAGEIAAATDNGQGISGLAFSARLLVAKVVRDDGTIPDRAEARAIRWAADHRARVINLSFGGSRDPLSPRQDRFSRIEQRAIEYAVARGALVVASVGNGNDSPGMPWDFASYPAALPHVLGVSAYGPDGSVPAFSNRDRIYNDLAAPGAAMFSTFPRGLTARSAGCGEQGYSSCASKPYRRAHGTSFAAPQVAAAAALLFSLRPKLTADQASYLLERTATDATAANGCVECMSGRDPLTGWGRLDVAAAVKAVQNYLPPRDRLEPNDDAGRRATTILRRRLTIRATIDFWDDARDVYRVHLSRGQRFLATLRGRPGTNPNLILWRPGTRDIDATPRSHRVASSFHPDAIERIAYRASRTGWYYLEVGLRGRKNTSYWLKLRY